MGEQHHQTEFVKAKPEYMPEPTYWPFMFAVSVLFLGWGLLTLWIMTVVGLLGMIISITGWIKEMLYERGNKISEQEKVPE